MHFPKSSLAFAAIACSFILAGPAKAALTNNAITSNAITSNAITSNAITSNAITANALTSNAITANGLTSGAAPVSKPVVPSGRGAYDTSPSWSLDEMRVRVVKP